MAKKVRWTAKSIHDRTEIYRYWNERNQSEVYSEKLEQLFEKSADLISKFPHIGRRTNYRNVSFKVVRNYKVFYRIEAEEIQILRVWDTRQHPKSARL